MLQQVPWAITYYRFPSNEGAEKAEVDPVLKVFEDGGS